MNTILMYNDYGQIQRFFVKTFTAVTGALLPMTAWCGIAYIEWFYLCHITQDSQGWLSHYRCHGNF